MAAGGAFAFYEKLAGVHRTVYSGRSAQEYGAMICAAGVFFVARALRSRVDQEQPLDGDAILFTSLLCGLLLFGWGWALRLERQIDERDGAAGAMAAERVNEMLSRARAQQEALRMPERKRR